MRAGMNMGLKKNSYLPQKIIEAATGQSGPTSDYVDICKMIAALEDNDREGRGWRRPSKRLIQRYTVR
jgi:hypothetical protein